MIPMILARPSRAWLIAGVALVSSVLGGVLGYAIGAFAYEQVGQPILAAMGKADAMAEFNTRFNDFGFWPVLIAYIIAALVMKPEPADDLHRQLDHRARSAVLHRCRVAVEIRRTDP